jgi:hypothetical protein
MADITHSTTLATFPVYDVDFDSLESAAIEDV